MRERYMISRLCERFVVTDGQSSLFKVMNDRCEMADNTDPGQLKFFGMTLPEAEQLKNQLNNR